MVYREQRNVHIQPVIQSPESVQELYLSKECILPRVDAANPALWPAAGGKRRLFSNVRFRVWHESSSAPGRFAASVRWPRPAG
jgi:hypothetical protein